jgi:hypothetical protein
LGEDGGEATLNVIYGALELETLLIVGIMKRAKVVATRDEQVLEATAWPREGWLSVRFAQPVCLKEGQRLKIMLSW